MAHKIISFNDLPEAISEVLRRLTRIEEIISTRAGPEQVDEILNSKQAAELLRMALPTLYAKIHTIPHLKKHKRLIFYRSELLQHLNSGRRKTDQEQEDSIINEVDSLLANANKSKRRNT
jgi:hypothetical protein